MNNKIEILEKIYKTKEESWMFKYLNKQVNNNFLNTFNDSQGGTISVYDCLMPFDLYLTVNVDKNIITNIEYLKSVEDGGPKSTTKILKLTKKDIEIICNILDSCIDYNTFKIMENVISNVDKVNITLIKNSKNTIDLIKDNKEYSIKKSELQLYIDISFTYYEISNDINFWIANNLDKKHFDIVKELFTLIDKKYYPDFIKIKQKANDRLSRIKEYENYLTLKEFLINKDYDKALIYKDSIKYLIDDKEYYNNLNFLIGDIYSLKKWDLLKAFKEVFDNEWIGYSCQAHTDKIIEALIIDAIKSNNIYTLKLLLNGRIVSISRIIDIDFIDKIDILKILIEHDITWPNEQVIPKHFFDIVKKINIKKINFNIIANELIQLNEIDLLVNAIENNALTDVVSIRKIIEKLQEVDDFDKFLKIDETIKSKLYDLTYDLNSCLCNKDDLIPKFIINAIENPSNRINSFIISKIDNRELLLTLKLNDLIMKEKPIDVIEKFVKDNNFGTNDYILYKATINTGTFSKQLKYEKNNEYLMFILDNYNPCFKIKELDYKNEAEEIGNAYIINYLLDDKYNHLFGFKNCLNNYAIFLSDISIDLKNYDYLRNKYLSK